MNLSLPNNTQSKWLLASTIGVCLYPVLLFLFPKGYIVSTTILTLMAVVAGYYKQLSWNRSLTLLSLAFIAFSFPHLVNLIQETTDMRHVKKILRGLPLLLVAAFLVKNNPDKKIIHWAFIFGLIICFIGMLNAQITGLDRSDVLGNNVIPLMVSAAALLAFLLPQSNSKNKLLKYTVYATFSLTISAIVLSQSKGVTLSALATILVFSVLTFRQSKSNIFILWVLLISAIGATSLFNNDALIKRINIASKNVTLAVNKTIEQDTVRTTKNTTSIVNKSTEKKITPTQKKSWAPASSSTIRFELWKGSLLLAAEKPFFGYGKLAARDRMLELIKEGKIAPYAKKYAEKHFHSIYFEALGCQGLIGLISILLVLLLPLYIFIKNWTNNPRVALAGILIVTNYAIAGLSDTVLTSTLPAITYVMLMVLCVSQVSISEPDKKV
ncbi:O-antigen ligase [Moritella viscosa]|uniref:O-antigen ligase family protein n=1 Tax=Moritella viscosa TaxID=80854 RepID=UPI0005090F41|nr:O-antigen ligase family protein [Moritella viscosa]CED61654.1 O-Antigen ligase [Moritella viscosa]SHO05338.1 O-antigen ligase [Moritella viscosa]SHO05343.1 O-antigen ligase [Moritella viscosa]SHO06226.1 O-antigen ligase [Moritella viscosa]SHO08559.1 O-antigen ligase [Moritella viscosa]